MNATINTAVTRSMRALIQTIDATKSAKASNSSVTGSRGTICFHPMRSFTLNRHFRQIADHFLGDSILILYVS
jgi:hypothetical protein